MHSPPQPVRKEAYSVLLRLQLQTSQTKIHHECCNVHVIGSPSPSPVHLQQKPPATQPTLLISTSVQTQNPHPKRGERVRHPRPIHEELSSLIRWMASFVCLCVCGGYDDGDDDDACEDVVPNFKEEERMAEVKCIGIE